MISEQLTVNSFQLRTKRLILREVQNTDVDALHHHIFGDEEVMRFGNGVQTKEQAQEWIHARIESYEKHGFGAYIIVEQSTNEVIGYCGLFYVPDVNGKHEVAIGYRLARSKWGSGYASEATQVVKDYAFNHLNLSRLIATIDPENSASIRVAEKLGMTHESNVMFEGYTHPDYVFALNKQ